MRRNMWWVGVGTAVAIALAGCGSTAGSPSALSSVPSSGPASTSPAAPSSSAAPSSAPSTAAASSTASAPAASTDSEAAPTVSDVVSGSEGESSEEEPSTITVAPGELDAQTLNWANTMCTGMAPMAQLDDAMSAIDPQDPTGTQKKFVDLYNALGDAFSNTAAALKSTPPPTFEHGAEMAAAFEQALATAGPQFKQAATTLAAAKVTDMDSLQTALEASSTTMENAFEGLDLDKYQLDDKTVAALDALPACKVLSDTGAGPTTG